MRKNMATGVTGETTDLGEKLDLRQLAEDMLRINRRWLARHDEIRPFCVILGRDRRAEMLRISVDDERAKYQDYRHVGLVARLLKARAVLMCADTWIGSPGCEVRPSLDPNRREALTVIVVLPDGTANLFLMQPYRRQGTRIYWEDRDDRDDAVQNLIPAWADAGLDK